MFAPAGSKRKRSAWEISHTDRLFAAYKIEIFRFHLSKL